MLTAFYNDGSIPSDSIMIVPNGDYILEMFGIMMSSHAYDLGFEYKIGGQLESRYEYSSGSLVYNNFPFPINVEPNRNEN